MTHATSRRILVVDDETSIRFAVCEYLTAHGYAVDCARDLAESLALLARQTYGVAVVDLRLTVTDDDEGLALIDHLRAHSPRTRVILLTAYGAPVIELEARRRGVDVVLHKPQPLRELVRVVEGLLASSTPP